jgi:DNA polymerase III alpha subunit
MDLHVHTCLSPCADNSMTPPAIAARAAAAGLAAIAVCDHNTGGNVEAVRIAGRRRGVEVVAGMEVTSAEEVHLLAYFADAGALSRFEKVVAQHMSGTNDPRYFGDQILADEDGEPTGVEERFLLGACELTVARLVEQIHALEGLAVASHVDKEAFSTGRHRAVAAQPAVRGVSSSRAADSSLVGRPFPGGHRREPLVPAGTAGDVRRARRGAAGNRRRGPG